MYYSKIIYIRCLSVEIFARVSTNIRNASKILFSQRQTRVKHLIKRSGVPTRRKSRFRMDNALNAVGEDAQTILGRNRVTPVEYSLRCFPPIFRQPLIRVILFFLPENVRKKKKKKNWNHEKFWKKFFFFPIEKRKEELISDQTTRLSLSNFTHLLTRFTNREIRKEQQFGRIYKNGIIFFFSLLER